MKISLIVAMAANRVIGLNNRMPWHLPADLQRFKKITMGAPILMGRKTFESIGRPLPGRINIIVSRNNHYRQPDCRVHQDLDAALADACRLADEVFVIGGAKLYESLLPRADTLYLTEINQLVEGDTWFPEWRSDDWQELERVEVNDDPCAAFSYRFVTLQRRQKLPQVP